MGDFPRRAALCMNPDGMQTDESVENAVRQAAERLTDAGWEVTEVESHLFRNLLDYRPFCGLLKHIV